MKLIIAGGRNYNLTPDDHAALDWLHSTQRVTEVVCGGATGADQSGANWARVNHIPIRYFHADWTALGRAAGPIRNEQMAKHATAVALFPGGRGTASMHKLAQKHRLKIYDHSKQNSPTSGSSPMRSRRQRFMVPPIDEPLALGFNAPENASPFIGPAV